MHALKRTALAGIAAVGLAAGASAALAATPTLPAFVGPPSKDNPVVKPHEIVYTGDSGEFFAGTGKKRPGNIHWTVWNGTEGVGTGANWIDNCTPNCASGKFSSYPVTFKAYRPRKVSKYHIFTRLKVTYTGKKFGSKQSFTWKIGFSRGIFQIG